VKLVYGDHFFILRHLWPYHEKERNNPKSSILKDRKCIVCGNKFDVKLDENNVIPIQYFFSKELIKNLTGEEGEYWECEYCSGFFEERVKEYMV